MPKYWKHRWGGYTVRISPTDSVRAFPLVPFFWDSPVNLNMTIAHSGSERRKLTEPLTYTWRLHDGGDHLVKSEQGTHEPGKQHAVLLGYLKPHQTYRLSVILTDSSGISEPMPVASFTVKDRDELYTQILIGIIVVVSGIVIGFIAG